MGCIARLGDPVGLKRGDLSISRSGAKGFGGGPCHPQPQGLVLSPTPAPPSHLPKIYQALLMSATFSPDVEALKELVLHNPVSGHLGGTGVGLGGAAGCGGSEGRFGASEGGLGGAE